MAGLLSVPATCGDRSEAGRREGRKGHGGRAGGERRAKERRRYGGEEARVRGRGCEVRPALRHGGCRAAPGSSARGVRARREEGARRLPSPRRPARTRAHPCARCPVRYGLGGPRRAPSRGVQACSWRVAVRPAVRSRPVPAGALAWVLRGSARCTGHSGLGEHRRLIPRRRRTGPGGGPRLPDPAWSRYGPGRRAGVRERRPSRAEARPGYTAGPGAAEDEPERTGP